MTHSNMPKQWKRWFKKAGLKSEYSSKLARNYGITYLKGHGRYWRLDDGGYLDMSERFEQFDRWANSLEASVPMDAKNEAGFSKLVERLLPPYERLMFQYRHRVLRINAKALVKQLKKVNLNQAFGRMGRGADVLLYLDSIPAERAASPAQIGTICYDDSDLFHPLSDEAEQASRANMRVLKPRPKGEIELITCGVDKGRSIFFGNPLPQHLKGLVALPPMYRGEPGPSVQEQMEELKLCMATTPTIQQIADACNAGIIPEDHELMFTGSAPGVSGRCERDRPLSDPVPDSERFNLRREYRDAPLDVTTLGSRVREYFRP